MATRGILATCMKSVITLTSQVCVSKVIPYRKLVLTKYRGLITFLDVEWLKLFWISKTRWWCGRMKEEGLALLIPSMKKDCPVVAWGR